jgi:hypothetical protein
VYIYAKSIREKAINKKLIINWEEVLSSLTQTCDKQASPGSQDPPAVHSQVSDPTGHSPEPVGWHSPFTQVSPVLHVPLLHVHPKFPGLQQISPLHSKPRSQAPPRVQAQFSDPIEHSAAVVDAVYTWHSELIHWSPFSQPLPAVHEHPWLPDLQHSKLWQESPGSHAPPAVHEQVSEPIRQPLLDVVEGGLNAVVDCALDAVVDCALNAVVDCALAAVVARAVVDCALAAVVARPVVERPVVERPVVERPVVEREVVDLAVVAAACAVVPAAAVPL